MKKIVKVLFDLLRVVLSVCLFVTIFYNAYSYLNKVFVTDINQGESFHNIPENTLDAVVLGSSHAQFSFVPGFFYEDTGLYSYVLGSGCQPIPASYQMLRETLKTQKPKVVFLEVFTAMPLKSGCSSDSSYVLAAYQMSGMERINTFNYLDSDKAETYYNDFLNNHNQWKEMENADAFLPENALKENKTIESTFGYVFQYGVEYYPYNWWHGIVVDNAGYAELEREDVIALENIYSLCKENDIELILYKTPIDSMDEVNQSYLNSVWKWAEEKGVKYVDFFKEQYDLTFYMWIHSDSYHCFISGAEIITDYLSDFVKKNDIEFNHNYNERLEKLYKYSAYDYAADALMYEHNPDRYLNRFLNTQGYTLVKYNPVYSYTSNKTVKLLAKIGVDMNRFNPDWSYYALIKDGEVIDWSYDNLSTSINGHDIYIDYVGVSSGEKEYEFQSSNLGLVLLDENFNILSVKNINTSTCFDYYYDDYDR